MKENGNLQELLNIMQMGLIGLGLEEEQLLLIQAIHYTVFTQPHLKKLRCIFLWYEIGKVEMYQG